MSANEVDQSGAELALVPPLLSVAVQMTRAEWLLAGLAQNCARERERESPVQWHAGKSLA